MSSDVDWQELAARGRAVEAIRAYCLAHGVGLAEGKAAVERWRAVNYPPSPAFQRAFRVARRLTDQLLAYLADAQPRSFQVRILPPDPREVIGQNTRFFSDILIDRPQLDLAVEVAMEGVPDELCKEVAERHSDDAVKLIWIVSHAMRMVMVWGGGLPGTELDEYAILDGGEVLPGFACRVADLFG